MIDIDHSVATVRRRVSSRVIDGRSARVIIAERPFATSRASLWDALTNASRLPRWFLPIEGELRVGGRYQLKGNAGGEILECVRESRFRIGWEMQGQLSWVTIEVRDGPEGTSTLQLEHVAHVPDEFWLQFGPAAVGVGWDLGLLGLAQHFVEHPVLVPESAAGWTVSSEGKRFVRGSSEGWAEAAMAEGDDAAASRAAAQRSFAFYCGA